MYVRITTEMLSAGLKTYELYNAKYDPVHTVAAIFNVMMRARKPVYDDPLLWPLWQICTENAAGALTTEEIAAAFGLKPKTKKERRSIEMRVGRLMREMPEWRRVRRMTGGTRGYRYERLTPDEARFGVIGLEKTPAPANSLLTPEA